MAVTPMTDYLAEYGEVIVFANVLIQQLGLPVPVMPTLVVAGGLAARGLLSPAWIVAVTVLANLLADAFWFLLGGRLFSRKRRAAEELAAGAGAARPASDRFARWGPRSLLVAKFLPGASQVILPMAAARGYRFGALLPYELLGSLLWASLPLLGGMFFQGAAARLMAAVSMSAVAIALAGLVIAAIAAAWLRRTGWSRCSR